MSLRKRGGSWWVDVVAPNGERIRRTTGTANKALAQEFHDRLKSELWRISKLGEKPRRTWNEAVGALAEGVRHTRQRSSQDKAHLRWLDQYLGGKYLDTISRAVIDRITEAKLAEGVSNATVNRPLEVVRAILRKCVNDWEWLDRTPQVRMLKEPTRRVRFLTRDEAKRLLAALPEHLAVMATFSLATGLAAGECHRVAVVAGGFGAASGVDSSRSGEGTEGDCGAAQRGGRRHHPWSDREAPHARVQLSRETGVAGQYEGLVPGARSGRHRELPLARLAAHLGELARAERHALHALQELGGWESAEMVRRYAHFSTEHLAPYADRLCALAGSGRSCRWHVYGTSRK